MKKMYDDTIDGSIPEEIMIALSEKWYNGDKHEDTFSSVTQLLQPPKMFWGGKKIYSGEDKPRKASNMLYALEGHMYHYLFERIFAPLQNYEVELGIRVPYKVGDKVYWITGHVDLINKLKGKILDWKNMSFSKYKMGEFTQYEQQTNIYAYLINVLHKKGEIRYSIKSIDLVAKIRDWSRKVKMMNKSTCPETMYKTIPVRLWTDKEARAFIDYRIKMLDSFSGMNLDDIPECNMKDRWEKPTTYPVFKATLYNKTKGKACKGTAGFRDRHLAEQWIKERRAKKDDSRYTIVERKAYPLRCFEYCQVADEGLCNWFNSNRSRYEEDVW